MTMCYILMKSSSILVLICIFSVGFNVNNAQTTAQCKLKDGSCTYMVNLNTQEPCGSPPVSQQYEYGPQEFRLPADEKMNQMQKDFDTVKSDHENRIKELENSIQKVLRNAIPSVAYTEHVGKVVLSHSDNDHIPTNTRHATVSKDPEPSGNLLLLRLQNQFNTLTKSLSERTADLLEARNKLNETIDLMNAAQGQAVSSSNKLVSLETKSAVLERENRILKNKLKDKTERYEYTKEKLNTTETRLIDIENQLYDVIRSEATLKEEYLTLKLNYEKTLAELEALKNNHTLLQGKYKKARKTLKVREEELMECYSAKTQTYCGFEDPDLCGFVQENGTDHFNWTRIQGRTPSANTGPEYDHTCKHHNGHYMYIEASGQSKDNKARMRTPKYRGLNSQCIEFYYHMYGRNVGTLTVFSKILTSEEFKAVWRVFGNQGNLWIKASISVSEEIARSGYQLIFEGATEVGYEGDISIDDFRIRDGQCAADAASLEATPAPLPQAAKTKIFNEQLERYRRLMRRRQRLQAAQQNGK